jgi:hypothetical protein
MFFAKLRRLLFRTRQVLAHPSNRNLCVSVCSILIALFALKVSTNQAEATRQHDRLMVRPRLMVTFGSNEKGTGWTLINEGIGPARIRGFRVYVNGVPQPPTEYFPSVFESLHLPEPIEKGSIYANIYTGEYIPAGSGDWYRRPLLILAAGKSAEALYAIRHKIVWEICYCSIYDECWLLMDRTTKPDDTCSTFIKQPYSMWWAG